MLPPPDIQVLSDQMINKIAAGEVVDRPASVIKELVENALDAGARSIEVLVVDGGLKLLAVADDGCGMDHDNALLSVERHATSKIRQVDDIERIATLGFRGEALAAIASVSRFTLTTRRATDLSGTSIRIHGGTIEEVTEAGCPPGTRIEVRQLFYNVPARRKFLKTAATELNHIRQVFLLYAIGRPEIALRLVVDDREALRLDGNSRMEDRIRQLHGSEIMGDMRPVEWRDDEWAIHGWISGPRLHRADKTEQYVFINGRPASAPVLGFAINEAFQPVLPRGRFPVLFLFIELPPEEVDVNVHPTKKEVRFRHATRLRDALMAAIGHALSVVNTSATTSGAALAPGDITVKDFLSVPDLPALPAFEYPRKKTDEVRPGVSGGTRAGGSQSPPVDSPSRTSPESRAPWHWCRILGQIDHYFVVLESDEGMILLDPQAAHERVLYDRMLADAHRRKIASQGLLVPETVALPPVKAGFIRKYMAILRDLGFSLSEFGGDTFIVEAMPALLGSVSAADVLSDIAADLERAGPSLNREHVVRDHIIEVATRLAVRTTTQLSREELERLISDLAMTALPYTSPRGRPTIIFTSLQELKKKFGRE